jgi:F0F1-type ATP synthase assembly protein I
VSRPPEYPGSQRLKRAAASAGSSAYQGVFEAVGSILIACAVGFWVDRRFETAPIGVLAGAAIGFGAFVLRLMRLGKELHPDGALGRAASLGTEVEDDLGIGEAPGISDALRDDRDAEVGSAGSGDPAGEIGEEAGGKTGEETGEKAGDQAAAKRSDET